MKIIVIIHVFIKTFLILYTHLTAYIVYVSKIIILKIRHTFFFGLGFSLCSVLSCDLTAYMNLLYCSFSIFLGI